MQRVHIVFILLAGFTATALAQNVALEEYAPRPKDAPRPKSESAYVQHRFLDLINGSAIVAAAVPVIGDSLSTQDFLSTGMIKEANPIARPFVNSPGGQAFISAVGFASMVGGMYVMHRLEARAGERHRKRRFVFSLLERSTPWIVAGVEADRWRHNNALIQQINQPCSTASGACK